MTKHTPGPWRVDGADYINAPSGLPVAKALQHDERPANAQLIAAAPELLASLKELDVCVMRFGLTLADDDARHTATTIALFAAMEKAHAAIRKAEGET